MKHIYWVLFSLLLIARMSPAENVSLPDAGRVARSFYYERVNQYYPVAYDLIKIHDTYICEEKGNPLLYIFNFENKGYVIVSAQDATYPVLGYSFEGNYQKGNSPAISKPGWHFTSARFRMRRLLIYQQVRTFIRNGNVYLKAVHRN